MPPGKLDNSRFPKPNRTGMLKGVPTTSNMPAICRINSRFHKTAKRVGEKEGRRLTFCRLAVEKKSAQQFWREGWLPQAIQRYLIFLVDLVTWLGKSLCEFAIVRQKQQTFSLRVETTDVEEAGKFWWKQIEDCIACVRIFPGRNESGGFVQHDGKSGSGTNKFAADFDVVVRGWLCAEVCADLAVDGDATLRDQLITM